MGCWGGGIFEGDMDLDIIGDVDWDPSDLKPKVLELRTRLLKEVKAEKEAMLLAKKSTSIDAESDDARQLETLKEYEKELSGEYDDYDIHHDCGLHNPRFPGLVRDKLNNGALADLINVYLPVSYRKPPAANPRWGQEQWDLVLISYCAMELGCTFPAGFIDKLKSGYKRAGKDLMMEEGEEQIRTACKEYVNGKPYEFVSLGLFETACMRMDGEDERPKAKMAGLEPVPVGEPPTKKRKTDAPTELPVDEYHFNHPSDTCANCGSTEGYKKPDLQRCKGCKDTLYCFEGCQKWHFFRHRGHCEQVQAALSTAKGDTQAVPDEGVKAEDQATDGAE